MAKKFMSIEQVANGYIVIIGETENAGNKYVAVDKNEVANIIKQELKGE